VVDPYHERVITSLSKLLLEAIDDFHGSDRLPSGSEAIRRPIELRNGDGEDEAREASLNELAHRYRRGDRVIFHTPGPSPHLVPESPRPPQHASATAATLRRRGRPPKTLAS
jgi:hypothetical protein